jgi:hypothetical protein
MTVADDCLANPACLAALASLLHRRPGYLHPYMSAEGTWRLAAELTARSGSPVSVLGPPPALTALVNNKCSFLEVARLVAGERSVIPFCAASELAGVAPFIDRLRGRASHFVIRLADSTAGLGARKLSVDSMPAGTALRRELEVILTALGWDGRGDFLLTEWVPSLASVSAQLWIPPGDTGNPACEGVYRQHLNPDNGMQFWGAAPARLPAALDAELRRLSCLLCLTFQRAGYVGRCSFDFVLAGEHLDSATPVFVECNGRWGGVSAVMSLVDRISRCGVRPAHTFGPVSGDSLRGADLRDVLAVLGGDLYDARQRNGQGIVLYYPGGLPSGRVDLCAVGPDQEFTRDLRELGAQKLGCAA